MAAVPEPDTRFGRTCAVRLGDGRIVLYADSQNGIFRFDPQTGVWLAVPDDPWYGLPVNRFAWTPVADGRTILAVATEQGIARLDASTGNWYEPDPIGEPSTLWDVTAVRLPDGRSLFVGAGHGWKVHRWDAATGRPVGEPLSGHRISVKAVASTTGLDGIPVIISGCEVGDVMRWNAVTGEPIGGPLPGGICNVTQLAVLHTAGREILVAIDSLAGEVHRWDAQTGESIGAPIMVPARSNLTGVYIDSHGVPTALVYLWDGAANSEATQRWRLDTGAPVGEPLPATVKTVYHDGTRTMMVTARPGPTLTVAPAIDLTERSFPADNAPPPR